MTAAGTPLHVFQEQQAAVQSTIAQASIVSVVPQQQQQQKQRISDDRPATAAARSATARQQQQQQQQSSAAATSNKDPNSGSSAAITYKVVGSRQRDEAGHGVLRVTSLSQKSAEEQHHQVEEGKLKEEEGEEEDADDEFLAKIGQFEKESRQLYSKQLVKLSAGNKDVQVTDWEVNNRLDAPSSRLATVVVNMIMGVLRSLRIMRRALRRSENEFRVRVAPTFSIAPALEGEEEEEEEEEEKKRVSSSSADLQRTDATQQTAYKFIQQQTDQFYELSDAILAELETGLEQVLPMLTSTVRMCVPLGILASLKRVLEKEKLTRVDGTRSPLPLEAMEKTLMIEQAKEEQKKGLLAKSSPRNAAAAAQKQKKQPPQRGTFKASRAPAQPEGEVIQWSSQMHPHSLTREYLMATAVMELNSASPRSVLPPQRPRTAAAAATTSRKNNKQPGPAKKSEEKGEGGALVEVGAHYASRQAILTVPKLVFDGTVAKRTTTATGPTTPVLSASAEATSSSAREEISAREVENQSASGKEHAALAKARAEPHVPLQQRVRDIHRHSSAPPLAREACPCTSHQLETQNNDASTMEQQQQQQPKNKTKKPSAADSILAKSSATTSQLADAIVALRNNNVRYRTLSLAVKQILLHVEQHELTFHHLHAQVNMKIVGCQRKKRMAAFANRVPELECRLVVLAKDKQRLLEGRKKLIHAAKLDLIREGRVL